MAKDAGLDLYSLRFEDASESRKKWCVFAAVRLSPYQQSSPALSLCPPLPGWRPTPGRRRRRTSGSPSTGRGGCPSPSSSPSGSRRSWTPCPRLTARRPWRRSRLAGSPSRLPHERRSQPAAAVDAPGSCSASSGQTNQLIEDIAYAARRSATNKLLSFTKPPACQTSALRRHAVSRRSERHERACRLSPIYAHARP